QPQQPLSPASVRMIQHALMQGGYRIDAADGVWGPQTVQALREFQRVRGLNPSGQPDADTLAALGIPGAAGGPATAAAQPAASVAGSDLSPGAVRTLQRALNDRGYDAGAVDGVWGDRTAAALRQFQRENQLAVSGRPDARTLAALGVPPQALDTARANNPMGTTTDTRGHVQSRPWGEAPPGSTAGRATTTGGQSR
ncbi:MAG TPA: peptidoglycan-binding domain-containing protein, partial [Burkholderiaceae bacterium]|nr:peptidoglycan-binding domain-containing protein [Burkholderiaceae bacterium]